MVNVSKGKFESMKILQPTNSLIDLFHSNSCEIFDKIKKLQLENQQLRAARDLLLPKLISGQLDVSELDIATEEMVTA